jgi:hypothetical protein
MNTIHCKDWVEIFNIHNKNGLYIDDTNGDKYTYKNNLEHSYNGKPAVEGSDGYNRWYLCGRKYSEDEYNEIINNNVLLFLWLNRDKL